jgi:outer membrane protein TolC
MRLNFSILFWIFFGFLTGVHALTLTDSIDTALKNNPSIIASQKKLEAASARLNQAVGAFLPTIKLDGNYGRSYTQPSSVQITTQTTLGAVTQNLSFGTDAATDAKGWTASLSQPLFVAALFPGYQIALLSVALAREDLNKALQDLQYNVTAAYFGVLSAEKFAALSDESLQMANSHVNQVSAMLKNGIATKADLLRAEVAAANSEAVLTKARNAFEIAKISFNAVLGEELDEKIELNFDILEKNLSILPDNQVLLATALDHRPDWKQFIYT